MKEPGAEIYIRVPRAQIFVWFLVIMQVVVTGIFVYYTDIAVNSYEYLQRAIVDLRNEKNDVRAEYLQAKLEGETLYETEQID